MARKNFIIFWKKVLRLSPHRYSTTRRLTESGIAVLYSVRGDPVPTVDSVFSGLSDL